MNRILFFWCILFTTQGAIATEPLHDKLIYQGHTGNIFSLKSSWLKKPKSKELTEIIRNMGFCSAIGGPVSKLKLENNKLYLTSLYKCGGDIELSEVYPKLTTPALATWLTGTYLVNLNYLCRNNKGRFVYRVELSLKVNKGIVSSIKTINNDKSTCIK